jgi:nitroimidazol reductase NimA-like FMN-containing flavoprotein (pyridoxamine 5'-phosphate oxidase superfamily)
MGSDTKALDDPGAQELLASPQSIRLACGGSDGFPRVVPLGFIWKGRRIYVCTATTAPKVAALRERPNVAGVIDQGISSSDAKQLLVRGRPRSRSSTESIPRRLRPAGANRDHPGWACRGWRAGNDCWL